MTFYCPSCGSLTLRATKTTKNTRPGDFEISEYKQILTCDTCGNQICLPWTLDLEAARQVGAT